MKLSPNQWLRKYLNIQLNEEIDLHSITMEQMANYADLYYEYLRENNK